MKPARHNTVIAAMRKNMDFAPHPSTASLAAMRKSPVVSAFMYEGAKGFMEGWRAAERYHAAKQEKPHAQ